MRPYSPEQDLGVIDRLAAYLMGTQPKPIVTGMPGMMQGGSIVPFVRFPLNQASRTVPTKLPDMEAGYPAVDAFRETAWGKQFLTGLQNQKLVDVNQLPKFTLDRAAALTGSPLISSDMAVPRGISVVPGPASTAQQLFDVLTKINLQQLAQ